MLHSATNSTAENWKKYSWAFYLSNFRAMSRMEVLYIQLLLVVQTFLTIRERHLLQQMISYLGLQILR